MSYNKVAPDYGFEIRAWMIHDLGLKGYERDVYAVVWSYTKDGSEKRLEVPFIAEMIGASDRTVQRAIGSLIERGLIVGGLVMTRFGERYELSVVLDRIPSGSRPGGGKVETSAQSGVTKCHRGGDTVSPGGCQNVTPNKLDINKIKNNKKGKTRFSTIKDACASSASCPSCGSESPHEFAGHYYCRSCDAVFRSKDSPA